jgi:hypothetical protein
LRKYGHDSGVVVGAAAGVCVGDMRVGLGNGGRGVTIGGFVAVGRFVSVGEGAGVSVGGAVGGAVGGTTTVVVAG